MSLVKANRAHRKLFKTTTPHMLSSPFGLLKQYNPEVVGTLQVVLLTKQAGPTTLAVPASLPP